MSHKLISGCHKCKVKMFHYRHEEGDHLLNFYWDHKKCIAEDISNVVAVLDNMENTPRWVDSDSEYEDITYKE